MEKAKDQTVLNHWQETVKLPIIRNNENDKVWDEKELLNLFKEIILRCGERNLSDNQGDIFMTLSGGLDSTFCLSLLRRSFGYRTPIHTFTIGSSEKHPDIKHARLASYRFKTIHHEFIPGLISGVKSKEEFNRLFEFNNIHEGDLGVYMLYKFISAFSPVSVIVHDGIDELLGGYWEYRQCLEEHEYFAVFDNLWKKLPVEHLIPLERTAHHFGINLLFPYLGKDLVQYLTKIPFQERTSYQESKIPLRNIAKSFVSRKIRKRNKIGFISALQNF